MKKSVTPITARASLIEIGFDIHWVSIQSQTKKKLRLQQKEIAGKTAYSKMRENRKCGIMTVQRVGLLVEALKTGNIKV